MNMIEPRFSIRPIPIVQRSKSEGRLTKISNPISLNMNFEFKVRGNSVEYKGDFIDEFENEEEYNNISDPETKRAKLIAINSRKIMDKYIGCTQKTDELNSWKKCNEGKKKAYYLYKELRQLFLKMTRVYIGDSVYKNCINEVKSVRRDKRQKLLRMTSEMTVNTAILKYSCKEIQEDPTYTLKMPENAMEIIQIYRNRNSFSEKNKIFFEFVCKHQLVNFLMNPQKPYYNILDGILNVKIVEEILTKLGTIINPNVKIEEILTNPEFYKYLEKFASEKNMDIILINYLKQCISKYIIHNIFSKATWINLKNVKYKQNKKLSISALQVIKTELLKKVNLISNSI